MTVAEVTEMGLQLLTALQEVEQSGIDSVPVVEFPHPVEIDFSLRSCPRKSLKGTG